MWGEEIFPNRTVFHRLLLIIFLFFISELLIYSTQKLKAKLKELNPGFVEDSGTFIPEMNITVNHPSLLINYINIWGKKMELLPLFAQANRKVECLNMVVPMKYRKTILETFPSKQLCPFNLDLTKDPARTEYKASKRSFQNCLGRLNFF